MGTIKTAIALILITIFVSGCVDQTGLASLIDKPLQGAPSYLVKQKTLSAEEEKKVDEIIEKKIAENPGIKEKLTEKQQEKLKSIVAEDNLAEEDIEKLITDLSKPTTQEILVQEWLDTNTPVTVQGKTYTVDEIKNLDKVEQQKLAEEAHNEEFQEFIKTQTIDTTPSKEVITVGGKEYSSDELSKMTEEELEELAKSVGLPAPEIKESKS
ncbi:MAG: hypothetical protein Q7K42_03100 [Candidatus Diapherotrites archaeon]|nr:hypothetical protein [Candidatus Diapherotrites archaeon]